jgi:hypothetical protein
MIEGRKEGNKDGRNEIMMKGGKEGEEGGRE